MHDWYIVGQQLIQKACQVVLQVDSGGVLRRFNIDFSCCVIFYSKNLWIWKVALMVVKILVKGDIT